MPTAQRKRILLADDQEGLRRLVSVTLGPDEFEILHASDGEEALRMARTQRPHLILLDVAMPKLDGFQVLRQLKADAATASIPIIMLTATGNAQARSMARDLGAVDYFVKPFSPLTLLQRVHQLLQAP
jgi:DNA-binding response OmpR family regulator